MVAFRMTPEMVGQARFAFSPTAEIGSALVQLSHGSTAVHRPWIRRVRAVTMGPELDLLTTLVPPGRLLPSFLYRHLPDPPTGLESQLEQIERAGIDPIASDLAEVWGSGRMPGRTRALLGAGDDGVRRLTAALRWFWSTAVEPYWRSISAVLEDDVALRAGRVVADGMYRLFDDLHPEVSVAGELLNIDKPHHADAQTIHSDCRVTLVPSVFTYPSLVIDLADRNLVVVYGAHGVARAWDGIDKTRPNDDDRLAALVGQTRATILAMLAAPMTTTQIGLALEQSNSTVSEHLTCLRNAGLLTSWRAGRRVFYRQTALGTSLVQASTSDHRQEAR